MWALPLLGGIPLIGTALAQRVDKGGGSASGAAAVLVESGSAAKISAMSAAGALAGTEPVPIIQGGVNKITTTQDIANLGGGGSGDYELISFGPMSALAYKDLALSTDYVDFRLRLKNLTISDGGDILDIIFSQDDGATWLYSAGDYDTYMGPNIIVYLKNTFVGDNSNLTVLSEIAGFVSLTNSISPTQLHMKATLDLDIDPGSASSYASVGLNIRNGMSDSGPTYLGALTLGFWTFNPGALVPAPLARVNKLRLMPDGNEDNPPTSGETMTGEFYFWGLPA